GWRRPHGALIAAPLASARTAEADSFGRRRPFREFEPHPETRSIIGQGHRSMVPVCNRAHQAQAQPIAGRAAARLQPNKAIEHRLAVALRDSRAAVADLEDGAAALAQHGDCDLALPSGAGAIFE